MNLSIKILINIFLGFFYIVKGYLTNKNNETKLMINKII